jgi:hypothetical protein
MHYLNAQFNYYYNVGIRQQYVPTFAGWKHRSWTWVSGMWRFFFGGILSISFITLPWVVRDRRMRLLLVQFGLSAAGLLAVVYLEVHYTAPLVATAFALWVQSMRHLRCWKVFGKPVGVASDRAGRFGKHPVLPCTTRAKRSNGRCALERCPRGYRQTTRRHGGPSPGYRPLLARANH